MRMIVAAIAAYMLVLQSAIGALAMGSAAGAPPVVGGVLCITGQFEPVPDGAPSPHDVPDCCKLGCGVAATAFDPPARDALAIPRDFGAAAMVVVAGTAIADPLAVGPLGARAPPDLS